MSSQTRSVLIGSAALIAIVGLTTPLLAAQHRDDHGGGRPAPARTEQHAQAPQPRAAAAPAPRPVAPPVSRSNATTPNIQGEAHWRSYQQQTGASRSAVAPNGQVVARQAPQAYSYRGGAQNYQNGNRYQTPVYASPRVVPHYGYHYGGGYVVVRPPVFAHPYYSFHPHFVVGFGLSVGYGFAYPFQYYDPSAFYNYGVSVAPSYGPSAYSNAVGGLSFDINPYDAAVFVDGTFIGAAQDFGPTQMPLTLPAGRHHIELRADGFMAASFDITIVAGQVIPYQGSLSGLSVQ